MRAHQLTSEVLWSVVAFVCVTSSVSAQGFLDSFNDGDAEDGTPVTWTPTPPTVGILDASSGDYVFTPTAGSGEFLSSHVLDVILEDTSIKSQVRASSLGGAAGLAARNQDEEDRQNYFGGIGYFPDKGGTVLFLGRNDPDGRQVFFGDKPVLPFDVRNEDAIVQLDVIGNELKLWGWRAGDPRPGQPQLVAQDDTYASGFVRIFTGRGANSDNIGTFRFVHAADTHITSSSILYEDLPAQIYAAIDSDTGSGLDGFGDTTSDRRWKRGGFVGERDAASENRLGRIVAKFALPNMADEDPGLELESATLRFFVLERDGIPAGPVSLFHGIADNDQDLLASDYEDTGYTDTLLDLVGPADEVGRYYELDVTDLVRADYAADGPDALSAFRLQITEASFLEDDENARYRLTMPGAAANRPELVLTFVPEPSTAVLTVVAFASLLVRRVRAKKGAGSKR